MTNRLAEMLQPPRLPEDPPSFSDSEAAQLRHQYLKDPSSMSCPRCTSQAVQVIAFIDPDSGDPCDFYTTADPVGRYAAAIHCPRCNHVIGLLMIEQVEG